MNIKCHGGSHHKKVFIAARLHRNAEKTSIFWYYYLNKDYLKVRDLVIFAVAPLAGAWIEMSIRGRVNISVTSLPSRERGLKSDRAQRLKALAQVAPLAGAWIEIPRQMP